MADKAGKQKGKAKREPPSVLGTLPATRPERIGRPRSGDAETAPKPRRAAAKPAAAKRAAERAAASRRNGAAAKPAAAKPIAARTGGSGAKPAPAATHGPAAVSSASPPLKVRRATDAPPPRSIPAPTGTELVTTTIRAAGELAQIGLTVGGQVLKRAVERIPKP
jgi:hypothetical protein